MREKRSVRFGQEGAIGVVECVAAFIENDRISGMAEVGGIAAASGLLLTQAAYQNWRERHQVVQRVGDHGGKQTAPPYEHAS